MTFGVNTDQKIAQVSSSEPNLKIQKKKNIYRNTYAGPKVTKELRKEKIQLNISQNRC